MASDPKQKGSQARLNEPSARSIEDEAASMEQALFDAMTRTGPSANKDGTASQAARDETMSEPLASPDMPETPAAPANDDRPSVGRVLREVQGRLPRTSYVVATVFAFGWAACGIILARLYFTDLQALAGVGPAATPALIGLSAVLFVPILFFYFLAHMMWRAQELRVIAQSMATMAMRFSEPETTARDALTTIGQAIRRDVSVMSDSVERALARASELQSLMDKEVAALERASNTSESRIRGLLDDLAHHRENLVGQTELLRDVVSSGVTHSDKAVDTMRATVELFDSRVNVKTDEVTSSLDLRLERFREALDNGTKSLETTLNARVLEIARTLSDSGKDVVSALDRRAEDARGMIASQGGDFVETLGVKLTEIETRLGERALGVVKDLDQRVSGFEQIAVGRAQSAAEAIASHSMGAVDALNAHLEHMSQSLKTNTAEARDAIEHNSKATAKILNTRMEELSQTIRSAAGEATEGIAAHATAAAGTLSARSEELSRAIQSASAEAAGKLVSHADAATEKLVAHASAATEVLTERADKLTQTIDRQTSESEQSLARFSGDVEQRLTKLSTGIATVLKQNAGEIETTMLGVSAEVVRTFVGKADEMTAALSERAEQMTEILDDKSGRLIATLGEKGDAIVTDMTRVTSEAVKAIEDQGVSFVQNVKENSDNIARLINETSGNAADALSRTIQELQDTTTMSIEASRKAATASVAEIRESHDMLRADSTNVFERLREANVLLQEVLSGAHDSMGTLETTLSTRLTEFVGAMTEVTERSGAATDRMTGHINAFQGATSKVLQDLTNLADQVESHGNVLVQAVDLIDKINQRTVDAVNERRAALDSLIGTLDEKTDDLEQRLRRFAGLLDSSLEGATGRAREIGRLIAESSAEGARTISEQFEVVRDTTEKERRLTVETMQGIYEQAMGDTHTLFRQTTERFADLLRGVKDMSAEMQRELDATRNELRRGVLELPQETAESAAQMRRVIVDQIEALAELNRFVARHARGQQQEARAAEPALSVVGGTVGRAEPAPRPTPAPRAPERAEVVGPQRPQRPATAGAPAQAPAQGAANRSGWLSDLLQRTSRPGEGAPADDRHERHAPQEGRAAHSIESLDALSADISRMVDHEAVAELWDRYNRGERNVFSRRLYTPHGLAAFDEIRKRYRTEGQFRQTIDHYVAEFERLLNEVSRGDRGQVVVRTYLTSETGKVYTLLAHAAGRFD
jgi:hypothetical protein